jgi:hypothetical protein
MNIHISAMPRISVSDNHPVEELSDQVLSEHPNDVDTRDDIDREEPTILKNPETEPPAADDLIAELSISQPLAVRETQRLYRLKAARFLAVVAADTEDEARRIAAKS